MALSELKAYLESLGSPLKLRADDNNLLQPLCDLLGSMPGKAIAIEPGSDGISLKGSVLAVTGSSADVWPVQGLGSAKITLTEAQIELTDGSPPTVAASLDGTLPLGGGAVADVALRPGSDAGSWAASLAGSISQVTPTELFVLATGSGLPFQVPPKLDLFDRAAQVDPGAFQIRFAPNTTDRAYYTFLVSAKSAAWPLIPGVIDFDGIDLRAVITGSGWSATIIGHATVGSVELDLGVQVSPGAVWQAYVAPTTGKTFPGIVEFAKWIAGASAGGETQQGFADLGLNPKLFDLALSRVTLRFEPAAAKVTDLEILSELTIVGLGLDLSATLPDLSLTGSLADGKPVKVTDMLQAAGLPVEDVPQALTIETADVAAQPEEGHYSVFVDVTGVWTEGPVRLDEVKATVTYDKPPGGDGGASAFKGQFEALIGIGKTAEIELIAAYAGASEGWTFSGGTAPGTEIAIGDVIAELATSWGIQDVPAPIASLELKNLLITYQAGKRKFTFACEGDFTVDQTPVKVTFTIDLEPTDAALANTAGNAVVGSKGYKATFGGEVTFGGNQFDIVFDTESTGTDVFVADYLRSGDPVRLADLIAPISAALAQDIPDGIKIGLEEVKFVFLKQDDAKHWAFGLRLGTSIGLSDIPVIGSKLPADKTLSIDNLQIVYATPAFTADQVKVVNPLLPKGVSPLPDAGLGKGIAFAADITLGSFTKHLQAGVEPPPAKAELIAATSAPALMAAQAAAAGSAAPASASDPIKWVDIQKQVGIFSFKRVGAGYENNVLEFALDAAVALGPLAFAVDGLTVGSPLTKFEPTFGLRGLSLSFDRPPIDIGGAFLKVTEQAGGREVTSFYGELIVQVSQFGLKAVGGWTPDTGSFFIYLSVDAPLGGPPYLFVTGVAGGFGINTDLRLPTADEVGTYILLPGLAPKEGATPAETIEAVLAALQKTISPEVGQYWVAAGIAFTSFEMIQARAVVSVAFGVDLQIGVVGTCAMSFPTGEPYPVAYVEVDVVASFRPSTGLLSVDGKLNPASNLFAGFVKLSGGFAFYIWFAGDHEGDFVVTLGGYHPAFDKPANYPAVPRLQLLFALGPIKVVGQAYFALVPSAFMAGLRISATWEEGPIKAWFLAGVDFIIAWAPFHYEAEAFVSIGCSVDLGLYTITVHIGAALEVWGPAFGGRAVVDLDVVSFVIEFGAARQAPPPVGWETFKAKFLPPPSDPTSGPQPAMLAAMPGAAPPPAPAARTNIIRAGVEAGKLADGKGAIDWVIDPDKFRILTSSTIPANHATWATGDSQEAELPNVVSDYHRSGPAPLLAIDEALVAAVTPPGPSPSVPPGMYLTLPESVRTATETEVWQEDLSIGPMGEDGIQSFHRVSLRKADASGAFSDYFTAVSVEPVLAPSNTALWGKKPDDPSPNDKRLLPATLTGLRLSAVPRTPAQVSGLPLLELIFGAGFETGYDQQKAEVDTRYTVASSISGDQLTIEVGGTETRTLQSRDFVLNALADPWVATQRAGILDELRANGFATSGPEDINVHLMATATALTDWPKVALLGAAA